MQRFIAFLRSPKKDWRHWTLLILLILFVVRPQSKQPASTDSSAPAVAENSLDATASPTITPVATRTPMPTITETPFPTAIVDANDALSVRLADITKDTLSPTASDKLPRLVEVSSLFGATTDEVGHRLIRIRGSKNITNKLIVAGMLVDAVTLFEAIATDKVIEQVDSVTIMFTLPVTDKYGNPAEIDVHRIMLRKTSLQQINWELFRNGGHRRLVDAADTYFLAPMLRGE